MDKAHAHKDFTFRICYIHRDEIDSPLSVVQKMYRSSIGTKTKDWGVREHFEKFLQNHWHEVPSMNSAKRLEDLKPGTLVRFRCMLQNVFNPEFYVGSLTGWDLEVFP